MKKRVISVGSVEKHPGCALVPTEIIENRILLIRGQKVMLSFHLATLYDVEPRALIQAIKRNINRFPDDFMFQLSQEEYKILKSQFVISSWGGRRGYPYAFTEQGIAMLSSVLNSERAIQVNIAIMRIFVKLKQMILNHKDLSAKLVELERKIERHDEDIIAIFNAIRQIIKEEGKPKPKIGFLRD